MNHSKNNEQLPEWNRDEVWTKIEGRLGQKKQRGALVWWWFGLGLLLAGAGFYVLKTEIDEPKVKLEEMRFATDIEEDESKESDFVNDMKIVENELQVVDSQEDTNFEIAENISEFSKNDLPKIPATIAGEKSKLSGIINEKQTRLFDERTSMNNEVLVLKNEIISEVRLQERSIFLKSNNLKEERKYINSFGKLKPEISFLESKGELPYFSNLEIISFEKAEEMKPLKYLFFAESGLSFGDVKYFGGANSTQFNDKRAAAETFRFSANATVGLERHFEKKRFIKAGLTYQTFFEKYENTSDSLLVTNVQSDTATIYDLGNGDFLVEPGIRQVSVNEKRAIVNNNFVHRLSIPLSAGYVFKLKKTRLAVDLGVRLRAFQKFSGIISNAGGHHVFNEEIINEELYSNQFNVGFIAGFSVRQPISEKSFLGLGVRFEQEDVFEITIAENGSKYRLFGANLGWYRKF